MEILKQIFCLNWRLTWSWANVSVLKWTEYSLSQLFSCSVQLKLHSKSVSYCVFRPCWQLSIQVNFLNIFFLAYSKTYYTIHLPSLRQTQITGPSVRGSKSKGLANSEHRHSPATLPIRWGSMAQKESALSCLKHSAQSPVPAAKDLSEKTEIL